MLLEMEGSESTSSSRSEEAVERGMSGMTKEEDVEELIMPDDDMSSDEDMLGVVGERREESDGGRWDRVPSRSAYEAADSRGG
jgi:hypothetical protein